MTAMTIRDIIERKRERATKLKDLVPVGTIVSAVDSPEIGTLWESPTGQYRGVFMGVDVDWPHPIIVQPDESEIEWTVATYDVKFFMEDRWWSFEDIVGEW
jgi:hypothetical protein